MEFTLTNFLLFMVNCVLTNNFIFSRYLGCCPFLGVSNKVETAAGMGIAVTFVMGIASLFTYAVYHYILVPLQLNYLITISFILVIAALVQFVEMFMKKSLPALYNALGIYLPLITTNCAVLGVALLNTPEDPAEMLTLPEAVIQGTAAGLGFTLVMLLMAGIRERIEALDLPEPMRGMPIAFVCTGLMALAFLGFTGMV